jgi:uncharacterized delta-60 repeat protein
MFRKQFTANIRTIGGGGNVRHNATPSSSAFLFLLLSTVSLLLVTSTEAAAQPGALDPSFGTGGIETTDFGDQINSDVASADAVTIQPNGQIIVCGQVPSKNGFPVGSVARYNSNGSLDTSFGNAGIVATPQLGGLNAITLQTDGKIVVAGPPAGAIIQVARYNTDGSLDTAFGTGGIFTSKAPISSSGARGGIVIQPNGSILVAEGLLLRLLSDGQLDSSFGTGGYGTTAGYGYIPSALALLSNGKFLVAAAIVSEPSIGAGLVTRYDSNGSLDSSFGVNGQVATVGPGNAMALLSTGELVVGGSLTSSLSGPTVGFAVSRYRSVGVIDGTFGTHGGSVTPIPNYSTVAASGIGVQSSGDVVELGTASPAAAFALARYTPKGQLDNSFGTNGTVTTTLGTTSLSANGMAIQADGNIVVVGSYTTSLPNGEFDTGFKLARYLGQ